MTPPLGLPPTQAYIQPPPAEGEDAEEDEEDVEDERYRVPAEHLTNTNPIGTRGY